MEDFFHKLFGEALSQDRQLLVFTLPDRRTRHFSSLAAAVLHAGKQSKIQDVYFGAGLAGQDFGRKTAAAHVAAIGGLWADIDRASPHRANKPLPRTIAEARSILEKLPFPPSVIIDSGYGLHAWWLFREPWVFDSEAERLDAAKIAKGWVDLARGAAQSLGWEIDSVGSLAQVMRPPGSWNRKGDPPVEVRIIEEHPERRYNPHDFEDFAAEQVTLEAPEVESNGLVLRADAEPPAGKFADLLLACPAFAQAWNRQRFDLQDPSQSSYDLSLANVAALNGWSEQEIAGLLIAARRKHNQKPEKALRQDYVARTIARARSMAGERSTEGVDLSILLPSNPEATGAKVVTPKALFEYDIINDPNTLLGKRWLCRAGSCLLVGQTGLGKSSFSMQAAVAWALGEPLFGIAPVKPLRSLVIQAENDLGDLSEMFCGVLQGLRIVDRLPALDEKLVFVTETARAGRSFHDWARALIAQYEPDLVWVDPLFAYLGGNVSDQEIVSTFLRNGLGAIAQGTGICWMVVHHANKPPKDPERRNAFLAGDYSYLGSGSAELANWARAVLAIREIENGLFELRAAKRGRRAGLVDPKGEPATEVYLRHGKTGICWERSTGPEEDRREGERAQAEDIIHAMEAGRVYSRAEIGRLVQETLGVRKSAVFTRGRRGNRVYRLVLDMTQAPDDPKHHLVTPGHKEVT